MSAATSALSTILAPVIPVATVFAAGIYLARRKILHASDSRVLSEVAFRLAIPAYLLASLYTTDLRQIIHPHAIGIYALTVLAAAAAVAVWARAAHHTPVRGVALRIMAAVQVNTAYLAIPVLLLAFGSAAPIFPVLLFQVLVLTTAIIAVLEASNPAQDRPGRTAARRIGVGVARSLTTPVVLACLTGVALNATDIPVPAVALNSLEFLGAAAAPIAVLALGMYVGGTGIRWRGRREENALVVAKCVGFPLLMWAALTITAVPDPWRGYLTLIAAMPAPQNLFVFAQTYDTDIDLAAGVVTKSTLLTLCLLPAWQLLVAL